MANEPYRYFRIEAREIVENITKGVMSVEAGGSAADAVAALLRHAHTLKGAARVVKQIAIADQAHALEDLLEPYRGGAATPTKDTVDAILSIADTISAGVDKLSEPQGIPTQAAAKPDGQEKSLAVSAIDATLADTTIRAPFSGTAELDELLDGVAEAHAHVGALRHAGEQINHARELVELLEAGPAGQGIVRELRDVLAALDRNVSTAVDQVDREIGFVRDSAEKLRLVPASAIFTSLERTMRDGALALGKRAAFDTSGGDVRLDGTVLGAVQRALVQSVRNAVAHGIETPEQRKAVGKSAEGRISIEVERRGRRVIFTCRDDGRGLDLEAIRRAALDKGTLHEDVHSLSSDDLIDLLMRGGISTSGEVTAISGRGVGLDIVREVTETLGGRVTVRSTPGDGVTFEMAVPLSLASLDALLVESAGAMTAIPLDSVKACRWLTAAEVVRTAQGERILWNNRAVPFTPLSTILRRSAPPNAGRGWSVVIVEGADGCAAIGVDRLQGSASVILRPLPELAPAIAAVAGATLDAAGNPMMVLDADGLVAAALESSRLTVDPVDAKPPILIVDDSLTTRMLEQSILESAGYPVTTAASGEEGLDLARAGNFALILVDIEMPGIDGFTFIERIRGDVQLRHTPAILVSSRSAPEDRRRGEAVGASGYVVKSDFDQNDLLSRIQRLVGLK